MRIDSAVKTQDSVVARLRNLVWTTLQYRDNAVKVDVRFQSLYQPSPTACLLRGHNRAGPNDGLGRELFNDA